MDAAENDIYSVFKIKFEKKQIDYAMFEITSKYVERYKFVEELHKIGYKVYNIGLSSHRKIVNDTEHLYSEKLAESEIRGDFENMIKNLSNGQSNFLFKSDRIVNEKCNCGASMNYFNKV